MAVSITALIVIIFVFVAVAAVWRLIVRHWAIASLYAWAASSNVTIDAMSFRMFLRGPFFLEPPTCAVFRLVVKDAHGQPRKGWANCGDLMLELLGDAPRGIEFVWDAAGKGVSGR